MGGGDWLSPSADFVPGKRETCHLLQSLVSCGCWLPASWLHSSLGAGWLREPSGPGPSRPQWAGAPAHSRRAKPAGGWVPRQPASRGGCLFFPAEVPGWFEQTAEVGAYSVWRIPGVRPDLGSSLAEIKEHLICIYIHTYMCRHKFVVYGLHIWPL